jgi:hypothetical protein
MAGNEDRPNDEIRRNAGEGAAGLSMTKPEGMARGVSGRIAPAIVGQAHRLPIQNDWQAERLPYNGRRCLARMSLPMCEFVIW